MMMNLKFIPKWWWANSYSTEFKELKQSKLSFSIDKQRTKWNDWLELIEEIKLKTFKEKNSFWSSSNSFDIIVMASIFFMFIIIIINGARNNEKFEEWLDRRTEERKVRNSANQFLM